MIKVICTSKSTHSQYDGPNQEPSTTYQSTFAFRSEGQHTDVRATVIVTKSEFERYDVGGTYTLSSTAAVE